MNDRSAFPIHADLLAQVATSEAEEREVRRILAPLTDAELSARNTARLGEVESAVAAYQRAPWPIAPATDAHRYSTCSGPCERGTKPCPTPAARERAVDEPRPPRKTGDTLLVIALLLASLAAVELTLFAMGVSL